MGRGARWGLVAIMGNIVSEGMKLVGGTCWAAGGDNADAAAAGGGGGRMACPPSGEASTSTSCGV